jgi:hypothetical protein
MSDTVRLRTKIPERVRQSAYRILARRGFNESRPQKDLAERTSMEITSQIAAIRDLADTITAGKLS